MKKVILVLLALTLLTVLGCSDKDVKKHHYVFKGENDDWTVVYDVKAKETFTKKDGTLHYDSKSDKEFTVTYKKDISGLASNKNIEITYESSVGGGKITEEIDKVSPQKTYSMKSSSTGGAIENADEVIEVNINIDGNTQTIGLKNE